MPLYSEKFAVIFIKMALPNYVLTLQATASPNVLSIYMYYIYKLYILYTLYKLYILYILYILYTLYTLILCGKFIIVNIWRWGWFLATSKRAAAIWASRSAITSVTIRLRNVLSLLKWWLIDDDEDDGDVVDCNHLLLFRTRLSLPVPKNG